MKNPRRNGRSKVVETSPEWEAIEAVRRNLDPNQAVQEVAFLQKRWRLFARGRLPTSPVDVNAVIRVLTLKRIPFVLIGTHANSGWTGRPRNTTDVDLLVKKGRRFGRAVSALRALYPRLEVRPGEEVTAFFVPGDKYPVIDVRYPDRRDLEETLRNALWAEDKRRRLRYRVPSLEQALANKYGAMRTRSREVARRMQHAVDFMLMVEHSADEGRQPIDLERLRTLGEMVRPQGGGEEILRLVNVVKAGRAIDIDALGD